MRFLKKIIHFLLAWFAYWFYGRPARKLIVIGVTGTKGKSTTCRLIASVLEAGGHKVGLLSTVEFQVGEKRWPNEKKMTMLGRGKIQSMLKQMVKAGCKYAVVETSSEGILQYRHIGLNYYTAVFTNLGAEHSERHGGFENLKKDKAKIFLKAKTIVANADDKHANYYLNFPATEKHTFGLNSQNQPEILGENVVSDQNGTDFTVDEKKFRLNIIGRFNVYNALAAIAVGRSQNVPEAKIAEGLASVKLVEGRMELVDVGPDFATASTGKQDFKVIVDYAHEPMSLTELFKSLREMVGGGKVISVVGSDGGGRDKGKREAMGEVAGRLADYVIITDVNCYDEDPKAIAEMLAVGARKAGKKDGMDLFVIIDRREAIAKAISLASTGDVVAITAKGTEPYIAMANGKKIPWDDRRVAREVIGKQIAIL
ncbi:MAG: UDP-N-acetylmuramoyl-L-alanyl-D-glutamate--2,6-diaminopimelate ligase [Patescibacteria group bacterium]